MSAVLRRPSLGGGLTHWLPRMPAVQEVGRYACKKKIKRFKFTNRLSDITCSGCAQAAGITLATGGAL